MYQMSLLNTHKPLSGQAVTFSITGGSATFDDGSNSYSATTDSNGEAYASVKYTTAESVIITAVTSNSAATVNYLKNGHSSQGIIKTVRSPSAVGENMILL